MVDVLKSTTALTDTTLTAIYTCPASYQAQITLLMADTLTGVKIYCNDILIATARANRETVCTRLDNHPIILNSGDIMKVQLLETDSAYVTIFGILEGV